MKVHLHEVAIGSRTYRLVSLRPATRVYFSTNFYHQTWHILSDAAGAQLLGRLLWGLSYQKLPGTMVLLHGPHLQPSPFEADPSDPILLLNSNLTALNTKHFQRLKQLLPTLKTPTKTIRWHTFGLDAALEQEDRWDQLREQASRLDRDDNRGFGQNEKMLRLSGFVCYSAPPEILRYQAAMIHGMHPYYIRSLRYGETQHYLADIDGEVQIFSNYRQQLSAAQQARQQIHPRPEMTAGEKVQFKIIRRRDKILAGRRKGQWRKRRRHGKR